MKDIVDYKFKTLADILAFLFLSWVIGTVLGLLLAMNLAPVRVFYHSFIVKINLFK
jgi:hypothetical protein